MNQQKIWDNISVPWKIFRVKPFLEVQEFLKNKKGKILDLGCGSGRNFIKIKGIIYGIDFSKEMIKFAKEYSEKNKIKAEFTKASINRTGLFSAINCSIVSGIKTACFLLKP